MVPHFAKRRECLGMIDNIIVSRITEEKVFPKVMQRFVLNEESFRIAQQLIDTHTHR